MSAFGTGTPFTVGLEEELLLVDATTYALEPRASEALASIESGDSVGPEAYAAEIELRSTPSSGAAEAAAELAALRARMHEVGATLMGAGVHPSGAFGDAPLTDDRRYRHVDAEMRGLIRRTPECALHVHVGMPDGETAIHVFNRLRSFLPLLQGLAANSPWWFGHDSGLASARGALVRSYPGRGIPRALRDMDEWRELVEASTRAGDLPDYTFLWSDVRLHPRLGTIEVREMDVQSLLVDAAALGALIRALALEAVDLPPAREQSEPLSWSSFRAMRDGVNAEILDQGVVRPLRHVARSTVERLRPVARRLGDEEALEGILEILQTAGGAGRRRRAYEGGGLQGQLEELVRETAAMSVTGAGAVGRSVRAAR